MSPRRLHLFTLVVISGLILSGCSNSNPYKVVAVSGKLMLDGNPVPGVRITFTPKEGRPSIATTNAAGEFEPWYRDQQNGVQVGIHTITIEKADPGDLMDTETESSEDIQALMERFGHGGSEKVTVEITEAKDDLVITLPSEE